jgi:hypothetical protein
MVNQKVYSSGEMMVPRAACGLCPQVGEICGLFLKDSVQENKSSSILIISRTLS